MLRDGRRIACTRRQKKWIVSRKSLGKFNATASHQAPSNHARKHTSIHKFNRYNITRCQANGHVHPCPICRKVRDCYRLTTVRGMQHCINLNGSSRRLSAFSGDVMICKHMILRSCGLATTPDQISKFGGHSRQSWGSIMASCPRQRPNQVYRPRFFVTIAAIG